MDKGGQEKGFAFFFREKMQFTLAFPEKMGILKDRSLS